MRSDPVHHARLSAPGRGFGGGGSYEQRSNGESKAAVKGKQLPGGKTVSGVAGGVVGVVVLVLDGWMVPVR
eukprot:365588-Chlamydomonas_euryale.AAC.5